jgi:molybdopterin/thiamine biosynthesis adenylyltransferase
MAASERLLGEPSGEAIRRARVVVVGAGRRGSLMALSLAKAGVERLTVLDRDIVRETDLDSGVFRAEDASSERPKTEALGSVVQTAAPWCELDARQEEVTYTNAVEVLSGHDLIVETTRSHELKQVVNEAAFELGTHLVLAEQTAPQRWAVLSVAPGGPGACMRCLVAEPLPPGAVASVDNTGTFALVDALLLGTLQRVVGSVLISSPSAPGLWWVDLEAGTVTAADSTEHRGPDCPLCVRGEKHFLAGNDVTYAAALCEKEMVQIGARDRLKLDLEAQAERLSKAANGLSCNRFMLTCQFEGLGISLFANGRANIKGTKDMIRARGCYVDLVGV